MWFPSRVHPMDHETQNHGLPISVTTGFSMHRLTLAVAVQVR
jgi:hypothetical protein